MLPISLPLEVHISWGKGYLTQLTVVSRKVGFLSDLGMRETEQVPLSRSSSQCLARKERPLFDFYHPKWEKEYVFELEESFTDWVIQVYFLIFLRRI